MGLVQMLERLLGMEGNIQQEDLFDPTMGGGNPSIIFGAWGAPSPPPRA